MRIDAQLHLWDPTRFSYPWCEHCHEKLRQPVLAEDAWPVLEKNRFQGAVVVQAGEGPEELAWLLEAAASAPWIKGIVAAVDDLSALGAGLSNSTGEALIKGVRGANGWGRPEFDWLAARDLVLHWSTDLAPLPALPDALSVVIDFDSAAQPEQWSPILHEWAARPNTYLQFARVLVHCLQSGWAPDRVRGPMRDAMQAFGFERVLFGSAWPLSLPEFTWKQVLAYFTQTHSALPPGERWKMIGLNAARVYRLASEDAIRASEAAE